MRPGSATVEELCAGVGGLILARAIGPLADEVRDFLRRDLAFAQRGVIEVEIDRPPAFG